MSFYHIAFPAHLPEQGHGVAAALYTIHLDALWRSHTDLLAYPGTLASVMTKKLSRIMDEGSSFATAVLGLVDLREMRVIWASAGGPAPFLFRKDGSLEALEGSGLPLGLSMGSDQYQQHTFAIDPGDCLLAFTDGALEVSKTGGGMLGTEGLVRVLEQVGYPASCDFNAVVERLLTSSDRIRFDDDLTFLEIRIA